MLTFALFDLPERVEKITEKLMKPRESPKTFRPASSAARLGTWPD